MKKLRIFTVLLLGFLVGCSLLPAPGRQTTNDVELAQRLAFSNKEMQARLQYSDWLLASNPRQRAQERERLAGAGDLDSRISLAMVKSHPAETVANRRAGLEQLRLLLPEPGLDTQAFLRSWIALGEALLERDSRRGDQHQQIQRLQRQIEQLSVIDEQLNQRKSKNMNREVP